MLRLVFLCVGSLLVASFATASMTSKYLVLGVIASDRPGDGVALLKSAQGGRVFAVREGERVAPQVRMVAVALREVTFLVGDRRVVVSVGDPCCADEEIPANPAADATYAVSRQQAVWAQGDGLAQIVQEFAAVPELDEGVVIGYRLLAIDATSVLRGIGFEDHDVIVAINGYPLGELPEALAVLHGLRSADQVAITLLRDGAERRHLVRVEGA